jgi:hypothetical protein
MATYATIERMNHPPLVGLYMGWALNMANQTGVPFEWIAKAPNMVAESGAMCALYMLGNRRGGKRLGLTLAALYALNPLSALLSAYHGNTDVIYATAVLMSLVALERGRWMLSGGFFALALNVKLVPAILVPPLIATIRRRQDLLRWLIGLAPGAIPFLVVASSDARLLLERVVSYSPDPNTWGITLFTYVFHRGSELAGLGSYAGVARYVTIGASLVLALVVRNRSIDAATAMAAGSLVFVILTPGLGIQYFALPALLLFAVSPSRAWLFGWVGGLAAYLLYWPDLTIDLNTIPTPYYVLPTGPLVVLAAYWQGTVVLLFWLLRRPQNRAPHRSGEAIATGIPASR